MDLDLCPKGAITANVFKIRKAIACKSGYEPLRLRSATVACRFFAESPTHEGCNPEGVEQHQLRKTIMKTRLALCTMLVCITSAVAVAQQVSVNYNHSQSFTQFHTYAWGADNANQVQNSILAQVAVQNIDSALQGKGWQKVDAGQNPDVLVTASGGLKQQTSYSAWGMRGIGGGMGGITPEQNVIGTLIVDLYDAKNQSLIWRAIGQNTLNNNGNKNQQMVQKAIAKMFKQWPTM
jgi:hypothetical protein